MTKNRFSKCQICGEFLEPEECPECGGEGYFDEYEDDPINYFPGEEYIKCGLCRGTGSVFVCPHAPHL